MADLGMVGEGVMQVLIRVFNLVSTLVVEVEVVDLAAMAPTVAEGPMASSTKVQGTVEHTITADQGPTGETEVTGGAGEEGVGSFKTLATRRLSMHMMAMEAWRIIISRRSWGNNSLQVGFPTMEAPHSINRLCTESPTLESLHNRS